MWKIFVELTYKIARRLPWARKVIAFLKSSYRAALNLVARNPILLIPIFMLVAVFVYRNPELLPSPLKPDHSCQNIAVGDTEAFAGENGDTLEFGKSRDCKQDAVIAVEFVNLGRAVDLDLNSTKLLVSSNMLIDGDVSSPSARSRWHEFSVFAEANQFLWEDLGSRKQIFKKDGCGFEEKIGNFHDTEYRSGVSIYSGPRADGNMVPEQWNYCNHGTPTSPGFENCRWMKIEIFVPLPELSQACTSRSLAERWKNSGVIERLFLGEVEHSYLRLLAKNRWANSEDDREHVDPGAFSRLVVGTPKLCWRNVNLDGSPRGGRSEWTVFGHITKAYCDF
ncbi:hypothetical protein K3555_18395 [Leisingera sp. M527]|uniref:hypothetical protein n=1 Tax=Leisingera sp. M527 TaxID=2867014 RepID=UPI0021A59116|nr:hypothetical protein [Leisingera sp. M527]UWQ32473.1 hypothetical protein K3555_18395 [Leisingera sp. M527]